MRGNEQCTPRQTKGGEQRAETFARLGAPARWAQRKNTEFNTPGVGRRSRERGEHFAFSEAQLQVRGLLPLAEFARFLCMCWCVCVCVGVRRVCVCVCVIRTNTQTHIAIITRRLRAGR